MGHQMPSLFSKDPRMSTNSSPYVVFLSLNLIQTWEKRVSGRFPLLMSRLIVKSDLLIRESNQYNAHYKHPRKYNLTTIVLAPSPQRPARDFLNHNPSQVY
jgi:hypothetical protein